MLHFSVSLLWKSAKRGWSHIYRTTYFLSLDFLVFLQSYFENKFLCQWPNNCWVTGIDRQPCKPLQICYVCSIEHNQPAFVLQVCRWTYDTWLVIDSQRNLWPSLLSSSGLCVSECAACGQQEHRDVDRRALVCVCVWESVNCESIVILFIQSVCVGCTEPEGSTCLHWKRWREIFCSAMKTWSSALWI